MSKIKEFFTARPLMSIIIETVILIALLGSFIGVGLTMNKPTASPNRDQSDTIVRVYGIGDDDVVFLLDGVAYPAETISHAEDNIVYTTGKADCVYNEITYSLYFVSEVAQGKGTFSTSFELKEALKQDVEVHSDIQPEYCEFKVCAVKAQ